MEIQTPARWNTKYKIKEIQTLAKSHTPARKIPGNPKGPTKTKEEQKWKWKGRRMRNGWKSNIPGEPNQNERKQEKKGNVWRFKLNILMFDCSIIDIETKLSILINKIKFLFNFLWKIGPKMSNVLIVYFHFLPAVILFLPSFFLFYSRGILLGTSVLPSSNQGCKSWNALHTVS